MTEYLDNTFFSYSLIVVFQDIVRIVYVDDDTQYLKAEAEKAEGASQDGKSGIRVLGISPDGQRLAAGGRSGNLRWEHEGSMRRTKSEMNICWISCDFFRIFGLQFMDELQKIEAHDSEVLCLAFSPTETGKWAFLYFKYIFYIAQTV